MTRRKWDLLLDSLLPTLELLVIFTAASSFLLAAPHRI
jgi:hypothetical protein